MKEGKDMSVIDVDKVDGIGIQKGGEGLAMLISDHLDWTDEYEHLIQLQNKLNAYIGFIENKQYEAIYPKHKFTTFQIEIHFKYEPIPSCLKFMDTVNNQLKDMAIGVNYIMG